MSAKFKLKNRENWKRQGLDEVLPEDVINGLSNELYFALEDGVLGLGREGSEAAPVYIDIDQTLQEKVTYFNKNSRKSEPFFKALKLSPGELVHDLTGGLLGDSLLMLAWGFKVKCFEGNPVVQKLIENAIERAEHPLARNLKFIPEYFQWGEIENQTFLYDPFFHKAKEKTQVNKEMLVLRLLDQQPYVLQKPEISYKRIIVKRHVKAEDLWPDPLVCFKGKAIRYDCY